MLSFLYWYPRRVDLLLSAFAPFDFLSDQNLIAHSQRQTFSRDNKLACIHSPQCNVVPRTSVGRAQRHRCVVSQLLRCPLFVRELSRVVQHQKWVLRLGNTSTGGRKVAARISASLTRGLPESDSTLVLAQSWQTSEMLSPRALEHCSRRVDRMGHSCTKLGHLPTLLEQCSSALGESISLVCQTEPNTQGCLCAFWIIPSK